VLVVLVAHDYEKTGQFPLHYGASYSARVDATSL